MPIKLLMKMKKEERSRSPLRQPRHFHWDHFLIIIMNTISHQGTLSLHMYFTARFNMERLFCSTAIFQSRFLKKRKFFPPSRYLKDGISDLHLLYFIASSRGNSFCFVHILSTGLLKTCYSSYVAFLTEFFSWAILYQLSIAIPSVGVDVYFRDMHLDSVKCIALNHLVEMCSISFVLCLDFTIRST